MSEIYSMELLKTGFIKTENGCILNPNASKEVKEEWERSLQRELKKLLSRNPQISYEEAAIAYQKLFGESLNIVW